MAFLWGVAKFGLFIIITTLLFRYWLQNKSYTFNPDLIADITKKNVVFPVEKAYTNILASLRKSHGTHVILPDQDLEWILMSSGGWVGSVCLLHVSLTEFLAFFGTAVDTSGHSGRYWMNISDTILTGHYSQWHAEAGAGPSGGASRFTARTYSQGDTVTHGAGEVAAVAFKANTWMVQYGRGMMPSTLPYSISDTLTSTHDYYSLYKMLRVSGKSAYQQLATALLQLQRYYQLT